jgi:acyl carrier protein
MGGSGAPSEPELGGQSELPDLAARLQAAPSSDRIHVAVAFVREHVMAVLRLNPDEVPERRERLMDMGFDSLMAVELKSRLAAALGGTVRLPSTLIFDHPTIEAIADLIRKQLEHPSDRRDGPGTGAAAAPDPGGPVAADVSATRVADLSDDEVEELLDKTLEGL